MVAPKSGPNATRSGGIVSYLQPPWHHDASKCRVFYVRPYGSARFYVQDGKELRYLKCFATTANVLQHASGVHYHSLCWCSCHGYIGDGKALASLRQTLRKATRSCSMRTMGSCGNHTLPHPLALYSQVLSELSCSLFTLFNLTVFNYLFPSHSLTLFSLYESRSLP